MPGTLFGLPVHFAGPCVFGEGQDAEDTISIVGDFNLGVYAVRTDITYEIFKSGVISDEDGKVIFNLVQQDMTAMRIVMRIAWQVADAAELCRPLGSGYPFAILKLGPDGWGVYKDRAICFCDNTQEPPVGETQGVNALSNRNQGIGATGRLSGFPDPKPATGAGLGGIEVTGYAQGVGGLPDVKITPGIDPEDGKPLISDGCTKTKPKGKGGA
jgi:hypothetical protein